jgi:hypothetical protein
LILIHAQQALEEALALPRLAAADEVNCHHNYTELEVHGGRRLWVTRKGAIRAGVGDRGLIPGSMGQRSYLVRGKGDARSYRSCAHGAGRRLSRRAARRTLSVERLSTLMGTSAWQAAEAASLLDESPEAYKPIDAVMADQAELVEIEHELRGLANVRSSSVRQGRPIELQGCNVCQTVGLRSRPTSGRASRRRRRLERGSVVRRLHTWIGTRCSTSRCRRSKSSSARAPS